MNQEEREAMQAALTAMTYQGTMGPTRRARRTDAISKLRAALAQPEQEPVGVVGTMPGTGGFTMVCFKAVDVPAGTAIYTHPA